jgi:hypothetical protein
MARKASLRPTAENTYRIVYGGGPEGVETDFGAALERSQQLERDGDVEGACNVRFEAVQQLTELIPDSTDMELDWDDRDSRNAMMLLSNCAIDHFLVGDFEMCAAILEMLLELDPEDHFESSIMLAYTYVALEEWELFDEVINDVSDRHADKYILALWSGLRRTGTVPEGELRHFKRSFKPWYDELTAAEHPVDEQYVKDIRSETPSKKALARELWIQTEHLWRLFPGFIEAISGK